MRTSVVVFSSFCVIAAGVLLYGAGSQNDDKRGPANTVAQARENRPAEVGKAARSEIARSDAGGFDRPEPQQGPVRLVLRGTMDTGDPASSRAFIAAGDGSSAGSYRIGDPLPGGEVLRDIGTDSIQVERAGRTQTLVLSEPGEAAARPPVRTIREDDDGPLFYDPELEAVAATGAENEQPTYSFDESRGEFVPDSAPRRRSRQRNGYFPGGLDQ